MVSRLKRLFGASAGEGSQPFTVMVVAHAEDQDGAPELGLSDRGREQAAAFASTMRPGEVDVFISGSSRASAETAGIMHAAVGGEHTVFDEFGGEGRGEPLPVAPAPADAIVHTRGGFDPVAAERFHQGLERIRREHASSSQVMVVSSGDLVLNAIRALHPDGEIQAEAPGVFEEGIQPCAMSTFVWRDGSWDTGLIAALTIPDI